MSKNLRELTVEKWNAMNCAQATAGGLLDYYDHPAREHLEIALQTFGGGMGEGSICGAVTGSMAAINLIANQYLLENSTTKEVTKHFKENFVDEFGSLYCRELLEKLKVDGVLPKNRHYEQKQKCTGCVLGAVRLADILLKEKIE